MTRAVKQQALDGKRWWQAGTGPHLQGGVDDFTQNNEQVQAGHNGQNHLLCQAPSFSSLRELFPLAITTAL